MRWERHVGEERDVYKFSWEIQKERDHLKTMT
jgi:hypothetical protein